MPHHKLSTDAERHRSKVDRSADPDGCWLWTGYTDPDGYGRFKTGSMKDGTRAMTSTHRFALEEALGRPLAPGMKALHACDTPSCCRNDDAGFYEVNGIQRVRRGHLFEGTPADNSRDMADKARAATGERNGCSVHPERLMRGEVHLCARLTEDKVREIRNRAARGEMQTALAREYRVHKGTVSHIVLRLTWKHVT